MPIHFPWEYLIYKKVCLYNDAKGASCTVSVRDVLFTYICGSRQLVKCDISYSSHDSHVNIDNWCFDSWTADRNVDTGTKQTLRPLFGVNSFKKCVLDSELIASVNSLSLTS